MADNFAANKQIKPWMYRCPGEFFALFLSLCFTLLIGYFFALIEWFPLLFIIFIGVIYVHLAQAQYLGNAIRLHSGQFPAIYDDFVDSAKRLGISRASIYIKQDPYLQASTLGITHCTVVLTSELVEQLTAKELRFVIGHELAHYAAGHTKLTTFIMPLGGNNIVGNLLFGIWNRKCEYTSDRGGLAITKDFDNAVSALLKLAVGEKLYDDLEFDGYLSQIGTADTSTVKISELLVSHPLITNRIKALRVYWKENFAI